MRLFIQTFMEKLAAYYFAFLAAGSAARVRELFSAIVQGLACVESCLRKHGEEGGAGYFLGEQYTLAEVMTAPFVVRMLANFREHRGVDVPESMSFHGAEQGYPLV